MGDAGAVYATENGKLKTENKKGESREKSLNSPLLTLNRELVSKLILLRAEAWEQGAISVTALNGYLENLKFWSSVAQHCLFHSLKFYLLNYI